MTDYALRFEGVCKFGPVSVDCFAVRTSGRPRKLEGMPHRRRALPKQCICGRFRLPVGRIGTESRFFKCRNCHGYRPGEWIVNRGAEWTYQPPLTVRPAAPQ